MKHIQYIFSPPLGLGGGWGEGEGGLREASGGMWRRNLNVPSIPPGPVKQKHSGRGPLVFTVLAPWHKKDFSATYPQKLPPNLSPSQSSAPA